MMRTMEIVLGACMVALTLIIFVVLPVLAFRRTRLHNPPGRDPRFAQHSERPMPDKSYLGQGLGGM